MTLLYITLSRTQEENKEKINKTQEKINKTQEDIYKTIDDALIKSSSILNRLNINEDKINKKTNLIVVNASYKGRLNSGDYHLVF